MLAETPPSPPRLPIVGSLFEIDPDALVQTLTKMSRELGPIYRIEVLGQATLVLGGQALVAEVCDETRFEKRVHTALENLRPALGDGLFTAYGHEPNWHLAHKILMPAFGPLGIRDMCGKMLDIAGQMFDRWDRFGPETEIDVADAMTRLTLDTLALCAFDTRFNSFYHEAMHPFVDAMVGTLKEASARDRRPPFVSNMMMRTRKQFEKDIATMHGMADALLRARRREGRIGERGDLLDSMLTGADAVTGARLGDENIRYQLATFLIAGHETTSGLLSFAVHLLLQHPAELERVQTEVDAVLGNRAPSIDDLASLRAVELVLMETLRLWPTAPAFAVTPREPTMIAGRYAVKPGDEILVLLPALHRDTAVWGADAEAFRPSRFAQESARQLPPHSWKPFGNGERACIGRGFAMQEALSVLSMMLQRFDFELVDPAYQLQVAETLTLKPDDLRIRVKPRGPAPLAAAHTPAATPSAPDGQVAAQGATDLLVLFGGNSGSCRSFAGRIAAEAVSRGFRPRTASLDEGLLLLVDAKHAVVVTSSYEGLPPENAKAFIAWLQQATAGTLAGLRFAVLGCGNRQWARTYQAVPKLIDAELERAGGERITARGEADAAGDFLGSANLWIGELWPCLSADGGQPADAPSPSASIERLPPLRLQLAEDHQPAICLESRKLTTDAADWKAAKHHVRLRLPEGTRYETGDHLSILPSNPAETVARALACLRLDAEERVRAHDDIAAAMLPIPAGEVLTAGQLLADFVELEQPATREQIALFASRCPCPPDAARLRGLLEPETYARDVITLRLGTLSLLESLPSCAVDLESLLPLLPPMTPRRYSISSSALGNPAECTLTISAVDWLDARGDRHLGVASTHMARLSPGVQARVAVRPGSRNFSLPLNPAVPLIMIGAGSGIAPFCGFLEERALLKATGKPIGPAVLYFGCRSAGHDWLYRDQLLDWQADDIVDVRPTFSRAGDGGPRYVQDRIRQDRADIIALMQEGAHVYVCGNAETMVPAVEAALAETCAHAIGAAPELARRWARRRFVAAGRYAVDAFA